MSDESSGSTPANGSVPAPLGRSALERVLARAAELHDAAGVGDPADTLSEVRLLEIAREVGLSQSSVRQALAEERTRVVVDQKSESGWLTRLAGSGVVSATRIVRGRQADVIATLELWMEREECLQVQRRFPDRVVWDARSDWFTAVRRNLRIGGRAYQLCRAQQVSATVIPMENDRMLVRLDADVTPKRTIQIRMGAIAGSGGVALSGTLIALGVVAHAAVFAVAAAAAIPLGLGGVAAYALIRQHQQLANRVLLALEQALDRLEFADTRKPASILDVVAAIRPLVR